MSATEEQRTDSKRTDRELRFEIGFSSECGRRKDNQDYGAARIGRPPLDARSHVAIAIADGVGGGKGGREAAELTVRGFFDGFFNLPGSLGVRQAGARALDAINSWIVAMGQKDPQLAGMATTFTALILSGRSGHSLHVGDSRLYRFRNGALESLSVDHVAGSGEFSHILRRAVGIEDPLRLDHCAFMLRSHERYLLCTDGVHGTLSEKALHAILAVNSASEQTAKDLTAAALEAGSFDNCTAIVVDILDAPPADTYELSDYFSHLPLLDPPQCGDVLDDFRMDEILSNGRYSRLLRAQDLRNGAQIVLKFPNPRIADAEVFRRAFVNEAFVSGRVRSPWIGETIELPFERQTRLYSAMPFYEGETLEHRLHREPRVGLNEGAALAMRIARAIATLHRAGVIHRDIKPDNILLLNDGGLKLLDLGVARLPQLEDFPPENTPGTPSYMAPELFQGAAGDETSDQFALGVTLYRVFTRAYPYKEIEPFSQPRFGAPAPLTAKRPDLPMWLEAAVHRAIHIDPSQRYRDVLELAFEIENGAQRGQNIIPAKMSIHQRNPVAFWRFVSIFLFLALLAALGRLTWMS